MSFGQTLKEIRTKNGISLRTLADKSNLAFTFIDKVEKGVSPPSENMLENLVKVYPLYKKKLILEYAKEKLPDYAIKELNLEDIDENFLDNMLNLIRILGIEEQKNILNLILEKIEYLSLKNGKYKEVESMINEAKEKIDKL